MLILRVAPTRLFISSQTGLDSIGGGTVPSVWVMMLISPPRAGGSGTARTSLDGYFVYPGGVTLPPGMSGGGEIGGRYCGSASRPLLLTTAAAAGLVAG